MDNTNLMMNNIGPCGKDRRVILELVRRNELVPTRGRDHGVLTYSLTSTRTLCTRVLVHALLARQNKDYWKKKWVARTQEPANNFARRAYKLAKTHKPKTILDVGCGNGRDSIYFSKKGLKVTAVDFSASGIEKVKSKNQKIDSIYADIRKFKSKKNSFDVVYAHLSLHYFDDKTTSKIFDNLYQTLKKDGLLFVKCKSTNDALFGKGEKIAENMYKKGHVRHFFSKEYMVKKLEKFRIIKISKTSSIYHNYKSAFIEAVATK